MLLKYNPVYQDVPMLIHDDKPVCNSSVILQYVNKAFISVGPSLLPEEPHDRVVACFWAGYIDGTVSYHILYYMSNGLVHRVRVFLASG